MTVIHNDGKTELSKNLTPISDKNQQGYCDLMVRVYRAESNSPTKLTRGNSKRVVFDQKVGEEITLALENYEEGQNLTIAGPVGNNEYLFMGTWNFNGIMKTYKTMCFIASGSGISTFYSIVLRQMAWKQDNTKIILLYVCSEEDRIPFKRELDAMNDRHSLEVHYVIRFPETNWKGFSGDVTKDI